MKKAILILAMAGCGKTYCSEKYENILDFDYMCYKYSFPDELLKSKTFEELKGNFGERKLRSEWPENYFNDLFEYMKKYDIICLPSNYEILDYLDKINFEYILCYPNKNCKEIYMQRYIQRGNQKDWLERMDKNFESDIVSFEQRNCRKIVLNLEETLEDKLKEMGMI